MRKPKYLSPSSIATFKHDIEEFYLKYLADHRPPRMPQTQPMAVGSAFDAYLKSWLVERLFGFAGREEFKLATIFEEQVEPHNRDQAKIDGAYVFECYQHSGALADLLIELEGAVGDPRFEFSVNANVAHEAAPDGIPLLGKPDISFVCGKSKRLCVYDAKVNGFYGKYNTSPKPGYIKIRDGWNQEVKPHSKKHGSIHKNAQLMVIDGITINIADYMENTLLDWARQLAIYGWVIGASPESETIFGIEQVVAKPKGTFPELRIASHRAKISKEFQTAWLAEIAEIWNIINSNHIFRDRKEEDSIKRCRTLDLQHRAFKSNDKRTEWLKKITRQY